MKSFFFLFSLILSLLVGCSSSSKEDPYIVSKERNDIKDRNPELWNWIKNKAIEKQQTEEKELATVDYAFELNRAKTSDSEQHQKRTMLIGKWLDCNDFASGRYFKFDEDGSFHEYPKNFETKDCKGEPNPGLGGLGYEYFGYFYIGDKLAVEDGLPIYEINLVYVDSPATKTYNESRVYFTIVRFSGSDKILFGSRNQNRGDSARTRKTLLDERRFEFHKMED